MILEGRIAKSILKEQKDRIDFQNLSLVRLEGGPNVVATGGKTIMDSKVLFSADLDELRINSITTNNVELSKNMLNKNGYINPEHEISKDIVAYRWSPEDTGYKININNADNRKRKVNFKINIANKLTNKTEDISFDLTFNPKEYQSYIIVPKDKQLYEYTHKFLAVPSGLQYPENHAELMQKFALVIVECAERYRVISSSERFYEKDDDQGNMQNFYTFGNLSYLYLRDGSRSLTFNFKPKQYSVGFGHLSESDPPMEKLQLGKTYYLKVEAVK
jgi:hypothetical protein